MLDGLERSDRLSELFPLAGVLDRHLDQALGDIPDDHLARADLLGTARPGGEWFCLSGTPLGLGRHNLAAAVLLGVIIVIWFIRGRPAVYVAKNNLQGRQM